MYCIKWRSIETGFISGGATLFTISDAEATCKLADSAFPELRHWPEFVAKENR